MAICARRPCPHDALGTVRYRPNPPARFLRAAADSNAHLLLFSPGPGSVLHHESAPETVRNVLMVQLQIRIKRTNEVYKKKKKTQYPVLERAVRTFARRESFFLFKLQPKRWLQWVQAVTETHPSNSCQSNMRTENRGMEKESRKSHRNFTNTITQRRRGKKSRTWFPRTSETALRFLLLTQPLRFCFWRMLSLIRAWRTGEKCPLRYPPMFAKRRKLRYPNYRRFPPNLPFILRLVGVEIRHDGIVNHVCPPWQLCHAESECPLLVRRRPVSLSSISQPHLIHLPPI